MKKSCNVLMLVAIFFSIIIMILCFIPVEFIGGSDTQAALDKISEMNGAPGSGELFAILLPFTLVSDFTKVVFLLIFNILIPGTTLLSVIILQVIARLFQIGENKKWKNIVSFSITVVAVLTISTLLFTLMLSVGTIKFLSLFVTLVLIIIYIVEIVKMAGNIDEPKKDVIVKNNNANIG